MARFVTIEGSKRYHSALNAVCSVSVAKSSPSSFQVAYIHTRNSLSVVPRQDTGHEAGTEAGKVESITSECAALHSRTAYITVDGIGVTSPDSNIDGKKF